MKLFRSLDNLPDSSRRGAVTIGNFDGVHRGHARIVERLVAKARQFGGPAVVFTFDPHPVRLLRPDKAPPPLTWTDRKADLLAELGIDALIACPTDFQFLQQSAREFFDRVIRDALQARAVVEGANFFFGRDRSGNVQRLREYCAEAGMALEVVEPVVLDGEVVSSSRIRTLVAQGHVEAARRLLTQPYRIRGRVVRGAGRGRQLGFPTANLDRVGTLLPAEGIYAGRVPLDGAVLPAAISLGPNPTFGEGALKVEVHLLDYTGWLYDRELEVDFLARLRDIQRYESVEQLLRQMDRDIAAARQWAVQAA
ncbi:MAG: bifunctional riboflavin kinase/FAD synthetase [Thermoguttaceae bacterium]|nr:bifunctional riboflavin kinase/FAD synthetase [Thermoguttaceae bacterium]